MNFIIDDVLNAIEKERRSLASWAQDKRHSLADTDKLGALRWLAFDLDAQNNRIAAKTLGIAEADLEPLKRVLQAIQGVGLAQPQTARNGRFERFKGCFSL